MSRFFELLQRNAVILLIAIFLSWLIWYQVRLELTDEILITANCDILKPPEVQIRGPERFSMNVRIAGPRVEIARLRDIGVVNLRFQISDVDETSREQKVTFSARDAQPRSGEGDYRVQFHDPFDVVYWATGDREVPAFARVDARRDLGPHERVAANRLEALRPVLVRGPTAVIAGITEVEAKQVIASQHRPAEGGATTVRVIGEIDPAKLPEGVTVESAPEFQLVWTIEQSQDLEVPLEVHWIVGPGQRPDATLGSIEFLDKGVVDPDGSPKLKVKVIGVPPSDEALAEIRAFVRSDEAFRHERASTEVHFANVPAGVRIELAGKTDRLINIVIRKP